MKRKHIKYIICIAVILLIITSVKSCYDTFINTTQDTYTSPQGTNTIIIKYDFVSRPTIYKKGVLWNATIWNYNKSGFMETVYFDVEWLSENQIRFTYDDLHNVEYNEEYIITIPD